MNAYEVDLSRSSSKVSARSSFMQGVLTNLLNPKCALFFISQFSQFVKPHTPGLVKMAYVGINWSITFAWFVVLSLIVTEPRFYGQLVRVRGLMDRVMGGALVILGMKLLLV